MSERLGLSAACPPGRTHIKLIRCTPGARPAAKWALEEKNY